MKRIVIQVITLLWVINEVLQATEALHNTPAEFWIFHVSSFFGAIVFCFLIEQLEWSKMLYMTPILIELLLSWYTCNCIDFWDIIFSAFGILVGAVCIKLD